MAGCADLVVLVSCVWLPWYIFVWYVCYLRCFLFGLFVLCLIVFALQLLIWYFLLFGFGLRFFCGLIVLYFLHLLSLCFCCISLCFWCLCFDLVICLRF